MFNYVGEHTHKRLAALCSWNGARRSSAPICVEELFLLAERCADNMFGVPRDDGAGELFKGLRYFASLVAVIPNTYDRCVSFDRVADLEIDPNVVLCLGRDQNEHGSGPVDPGLDDLAHDVVGIPRSVRLFARNRAIAGNYAVIG